jgi:hypothetical protein
MKNKKAILVFMAVIAILALTACKPKAAEVTVTSVTFAENLDDNYQPINPTTQFYTTSTIYVSVRLAGVPKTGSINGKFYYGDQLISEAGLEFASVGQGVIYSTGNETYVGFNLSPSAPWPVDTDYRFELILNGVKVGDYAYQVIQ